MTWAPWAALGRRIQSERQRENFLWPFGPLSVLMLMGVWALGLILGFALLRNLTEGRSFGRSIYTSATTFFTVGLADAGPTSTLDAIMAVIEGGSGFSFLALVISYLPTFYQVFSRRELNISLLDARAGSPPTAVELLKRHYYQGHLINLEQFFPDWEHWAAELLESHMSYPMVGLFRSQHENQSWLSTLTMVLDASALVAATFDDPIVYRANLTFAMARHAVVDLSQIYFTAPRPATNDRRLSVGLAELKELFGESAKVNEVRLGELRKLYEPYVNGLSQLLLMPLPNWTAVAGAQDNWQTTAWTQIDGAIPE
jgi:hypothetical protein